MEQQKYWECFGIKTGRWVEFKLYWVRLTLPAASTVVRVAVGAHGSQSWYDKWRRGSCFVGIWTPSTMLCEESYKSMCTSINGSWTWKSCQRVEEEWDHPDQEVIDNAISEWRKLLTACVAAGGGHFEHSLSTLLHLFTYWLTCSEPC